MPVSTALVPVLPSLYLSSKAQRLHPFPLPLAVFAFAALLSLSSSPLPASFPPPLALNSEWQLNIDPSTLRSRHSQPTDRYSLGLSLTGVWDLESRFYSQCVRTLAVPSHPSQPTSLFRRTPPSFTSLRSLHTSPPDTPEVSFGLYFTNVVSIATNASRFILRLLLTSSLTHSPSHPLHNSPDTPTASHAASTSPASSASLQTPPDAHGPGLIKVTSAEWSPIEAPVILHSHSISTSAKPMAIAQGRSYPTNRPPLVALDLYLTNIVSLTSTIAITPGKSTFAHLPLSLTLPLSRTDHFIPRHIPHPPSTNRIISLLVPSLPLASSSSVALGPPGAQGPGLVKVMRRRYHLM
ncbi:hypothetical protein EDB89DRAFT_2076197 [Lactarius sanguifluus]|nr:hypothetical protein EDB89DRAFT_2076197 [Lactarius sanguifluus]